MKRVWIDSSEINLKSALRNLKSAILLSAMLFALCLPADAQQPKKVYRVGYLSPRLGLDFLAESFRQGLRELGYIDGQNVAIEWRFARGKNELFPDLAAELVRLRSDCILAVGVAAIRAVKQINTRFL